MVAPCPWTTRHNLLVPLKGFLGDFVEFEHNEGDNDFINLLMVILLCHQMIF